MNPDTWNDPQGVENYISGRVESEADRFVLERLRELSPETLLELGTGPGTVMRKAGFIGSYVAGDLSLEFLKRLNSKFSLCFSPISIPLQSSVFDCALAMAVFHHLNCSELTDALRETRRILKPGGTFIFLEDWCFVRGETSFEEEARKYRFRYGTRENHLAEGTWLLEFQRAGFICRRSTWVRRPFHTTHPILAKWPENKRKVRMLCLEMERIQ